VCTNVRSATRSFHILSYFSYYFHSVSDILNFPLIKNLSGKLLQHTQRIIIIGPRSFKLHILLCMLFIYTKSLDNIAEGMLPLHI